MDILEHFLHIISQDEFVEGHEVLEVLWHKYKKIPEKETEAKILKGLINGSTALALAVKKKYEGANRVWETFEKYAVLIPLTNSPYTSLYQQAETALRQKHAIYMKNVEISR